MNDISIVFGFNTLLPVKTFDQYLFLVWRLLCYPLLRWGRLTLKYAWFLETSILALDQDKTIFIVSNI